ncbi:hypothetical protein ICW40_14810 [Actinotalea ferrariae]|uniref:variant leucine-rich repeat-containing protein n=1 Tax=Actinotalea ferrariae TaxID=1386098 RepID=UPI001C8B7A37|nr:hypothetical protein [Actinotalea ferrariae]MBX9246071.1 hypothetical protein [Actinotalea ferrariae]
MTDAQGFTAAQAADPGTPGQVLADIAAQRPDLRPAVASNPAAYPGLLQWLGALGDPSVDAALAARPASPDAPTEVIGAPADGAPQAGDAETQVLPAEHDGGAPSAPDEAPTQVVPEAQTQVLPEAQTGPTDAQTAADRPAAPPYSAPSPYAPQTGQQQGQHGQPYGQQQGQQGQAYGQQPGQPGQPYGQQPGQQSQPYGQPPYGQSGAQPYGQGAPGQQQPYGAPATAYGQPAQGPATAYGQAPATAYAGAGGGAGQGTATAYGQPYGYQPGSTPPAKSNKTLWIVLAVVGGVIVLGIAAFFVIRGVLGSLGPDGTYGSDPELDALYDACADEDWQACDDLYMESPRGSEYEAFGDSCGGRTDGGTYCTTEFGTDGGTDGGTDEGEEGTDEGGASDPNAYGDDPELDALWDQCAAGDGAACDDLYISAPLGSEYEEFGNTCGGTTTGGGSCQVDEGTESGASDTYGDDPELDALWDACAGGDNAACDDLFMESGFDTGYEEFGETCGGRGKPVGQIWCDPAA